LYYILRVDFKSTSKRIKERGAQMTNTKLLNEIIDKSGYKRSFIAKAIGLKSAYGLAKKIRNETEFKATEINALCKLLKIESLAEKERIFFASKVD
jgi:hypothetical protein